MEYYKAGALVSEHRREITKLSQGLDFTFNLADPSIFLKTQQKYGGRWSTADEYSDVSNLPDNTALFWLPADNNEFATRNRISEYLRVDPEWINPFTKEMGAPRLYFIVRDEHYPIGCDHAIRETRAQRRVKLGTELGKPIFSDERDDKIPDHAYDCLRYFVASRPPAASLAKIKQPANSFKSVQQRLQNFRKKGGYKLLAKQARRDALRLGK